MELVQQKETNSMIQMLQQLQEKVIVLAEEIVSEEEIRRDPAKNSIPQFCVDAVVHVPYGTHPSQLYNYYDYDADFYKMYDKVTKTDEDFENYIQEWVIEC